MPPRDKSPRPRRARAARAGTTVLAILALAALALLVPLAGPGNDISSITGMPGASGIATFPVDAARPVGRPFGASLHFPGELENDIAPETTSFAACGFGWTRTCNFRWDFMERTPGNFSAIHDPTAYHNVFLQNMKAINTRVLPLIDGSPAWLNEVSPYYISQGNRPLLRRYVNETVTAFQQDIQAWELFNEPNNEWGRHAGTWDEFFTILIDAAETIKRVNATLDVLVGGLGGYRELEFLDALLHHLTTTPTTVPGFAVARDLFTGIAFHPYTSPPENLAVKLMEYDAILARYTWTARDGARHWITEIGSETDHPRDGAGGFLVDPQREFATMIAKQMAIAITWPVDGFNIWEYRDWDPPGAFTRDFPHAGIVYQDASWKGATHACHWFNTQVGNGHMSVMPVRFPFSLAGVATRRGDLVDGLERWAVVAWNHRHHGALLARVEAGRAVHAVTIHDHASAETTPVPVVAGANGFDVLAGHDPVLLVIDCEPGAMLSITVVADVAGGLAIALLAAAIALVAVHATARARHGARTGGAGRAG